MDTYLLKLKHILPTYVVIAWGTVLVLCLVRWLLCIQFRLVDINEEVWNLFLPFALPWIPITLWMRQRFRVLTLNKSRNNDRTVFQIITWLMMAAMLILSQSYLTTALGKMTRLTTVREISQVEPTKYYQLKQFAVDPTHGGTSADIRTAGKNQQELKFDVYFVAPILSSSTEKTASCPRVWYGVKFHEQTRRSRNNEKNAKAFDDFYAKCVRQIAHYDYHALDHFERTPTSHDRTYFLKAIETSIGRAADDSFVVLEPIKENYQDRNGNKLAWVFGAFGIGLVVMLVALSIPGYSEAERQKFLSGKKPKHDDLDEILAYLVPRGEHFGTSLLIDLNLIVFLLMAVSGVNILSPNGIELLRWGCNPARRGPRWRVVAADNEHVCAQRDHAPVI